MAAGVGVHPACHPSLCTRLMEKIRKAQEVRAWIKSMKVSQRHSNKWTLGLRSLWAPAMRVPLSHSQPHA